MDKKTLVKKFIEFSRDNLNIKRNFVVRLVTDREGNGITTTAYYDLDSYLICVYIKNRALVDIMRSIAHEMVHHLQNEEGRIKNYLTDGDDGSDIENEANAKAGELIRIFGKQNIEIYTL
jgi:Zn-dependent peptidase ImmA (M78 family)